MFSAIQQGSRLRLPPSTTSFSSSAELGGHAVKKAAAAAAPVVVGGGGNVFGLRIECSSRPQKKATKHHMKTRPRKTQAWDIRRKGPTVYPPLPPLPPDWTLLTLTDVDNDSSAADAPPPPPSAAEPADAAAAAPPPPPAAAEPVSTESQ